MQNAYSAWLRAPVRSGGGDGTSAAGTGVAFVDDAMRTEVADGRVVPVLRRTWSRCPCTIAADWGGYLRTSAEVISGKEERKPASMALHSVDSAGSHMAACRKAMRCSSVAIGGHGRAME